MKRSFLRMTMGMAAGALFMMGGCAGVETAPAGKPLYDRLGGKLGIASVVDQFVAYVANDTRINGRFATTDIQKFKGHLVDQLCMATGGPCMYTGRDMKVAHMGMKITNGEFGALIEDFARAMDTFKVRAKENGELSGLLGAMKKDIVE